MNKNDLQTEIKALQEYRREAESLIEKINSVTKKMENDVVNDIEKIKKQIAEDMNEMFTNTQMLQGREIMAETKIFRQSLRSYAATGIPF